MPFPCVRLSFCPLVERPVGYLCWSVCLQSVLIHFPVPVWCGTHLSYQFQFDVLRSMLSVKVLALVATAMVPLNLWPDK